MRSKMSYVYPRLGYDFCHGKFYHYESIVDDYPVCRTPEAIKNIRNGGVGMVEVSLPDEPEEICKDAFSISYCIDSSETVVEYVWDYDEFTNSFAERRYFLRKGATVYVTCHVDTNTILVYSAKIGPNLRWSYIDKINDSSVIDAVDDWMRKMGLSHFSDR